MKLTGEDRSTRGKTCPSATLSTTNPTWTDPGSKPGLRGERPATSRLSHGTAKAYNFSMQHVTYKIHNNYRNTAYVGLVTYLVFVSSQSHVVQFRQKFCYSVFAIVTEWRMNNTPAFCATGLRFENTRIQCKFIRISSPLTSD
jgi:hypothetical protein